MGMFDGAISQAQKVLDEEVRTKFQPMFDKAVGELQADRAADEHLDASVVALQHAMDANTAMQRAMLAQMRALNAHPAVAARPATHA